MKRINYTQGELIGNLTFEKEVEAIKGYRRAEFKCPFCSEFFKTRISDAKNFKATKCRKCAVGLNKTDKDTKRIQSIRKGMVQRCYNPNRKDFLHYGARGISICNMWKKNSKAFVKWALSNGYKEGLTIERVDVDGNYEPSNCTWIAKAKQVENKRDLRKYKYLGVYPHSNGFVAKISVNSRQTHIGWHKTEKEAALARDNYILKHRLKRKLNF